MEVLIPNDDPVRLLSVFVEDMELTDLYRTYGKIKKEQVTPRQLFKIVIYAAMNRIYSSRDIETTCPSVTVTSSLMQDMKAKRTICI